MRQKNQRTLARLRKERRVRSSLSCDRKRIGRVAHVLRLLDRGSLGRIPDVCDERVRFRPAPIERLEGRETPMREADFIEADLCGLRCNGKREKERTKTEVDQSSAFAVHVAPGLRQAGTL